MVMMLIDDEEADDQQQLEECSNRLIRVGIAVSEAVEHRPQIALVLDLDFAGHLRVACEEVSDNLLGMKTTWAQISKRTFRPQRKRYKLAK